MATFLVLARDPTDDPVADADRVVFVRDGFSWLAALLTLPWLLWHRAWLAALAWTLGLVLASAAVAAAGDAYGAGLVDPLSTLVALAFALVAGFEANGWRARAMQRRGFRLAGTVTGRRREDCERRFFSAWLAGRGLGPGTDGIGSEERYGPRFGEPGPGEVAVAGPVLGLFPKPEPL